jgi:hypothetical protein
MEPEAAVQAGFISVKVCQFHTACTVQNYCAGCTAQTAAAHALVLGPFHTAKRNRPLLLVQLLLMV